MHRLLLALALLVSSVGCSPFGTIPAVGLDSTGKEMSWTFQENLFNENFLTYLNEVNTSVLPILEEKSRKASPWHLGEVGVGLGLRAGASVGPLSLKGQLGVTVIFAPGVRQ